MRWTGFILSLCVFILAGCFGNEDSESGIDALEVQAATLFVPEGATLVTGCETDDVESWLEIITVNARAFREESFGIATLPPDGVLNAMARMGALQTSILQTPVPECLTPIYGDLQTFSNYIMEAFRNYSAGTIDQVQLLEIVTREHVVYDETIKPQLDETIQLLEELQAQ